ncbi:hypothetical protein ACVW0Q_000154 [Thermostichus sp. MS-CIW-21]
MRPVYLQVLERNPRRLRIALQRFTPEQLAWRVVVGLGLLALGSQLWGRSPLVGLLAVAAGLGIGIPWGLGQILSLDRERQRATLTRLGGPWGLWRQQVFSYPLAQLQGVRLQRLGQEILDEEARESFQIQAQVRLQFRRGAFEQKLEEKISRRGYCLLQQPIGDQRRRAGSAYPGTAAGGLDPGLS